MKKILIQLFCAVTLTLCQLVPASAGRVAEVANAPAMYQKAELPVGGKLVQHPKDKQQVFYFIEKRQLYKDKDNWQKKPGLYHSTDAGNTWQLLCSWFDFQDLFIHPATGQLFAFVDDTYLAPLEDGSLAPHPGSKAISSLDGRKWKDIMGKKQRVSGFLGLSIRLDPNHPNRIRLLLHGFRRFYLESVDDNYTDWKILDVLDGPQF